MQRFRYIAILSITMSLQFSVAHAKTTVDAYFHSPLFGVDIETRKHELNTRVKTSASQKTGDLEKTDAALNLTSVYSSPWMTQSFKAGLDYTSSGSTDDATYLEEREYSVNHTVNVYFTTRSYGLLRGSWGRNTASGMENNFSARIGLGYFFIETVAIVIRGELGYQATLEEYTGDDPNNEFESSYGGVKVLWKFTPSASFTFEADFSQNTKDSSDQTAEAGAALTFVVMDGMSASFNYHYHFDGSPPAMEKKKVNTTLGFSMAVDF